MDGFIFFSWLLHQSLQVPFSVVTVLKQTVFLAFCLPLQLLLLFGPSRFLLFDLYKASSPRPQQLCYKISTEAEKNISLFIHIHKQEKTL